MGNSIRTLVLTALGAMACLQLQAQTPPQPAINTMIAPATMPQMDPSLVWRNAIKLQPFALFGQGLEFGYEHLGDNLLNGYHFSLGVFVGTDPYFYEPSDEYFGIRAEFQPRFYLQPATRGRFNWFVAPFVMYKHIEVTNFRSDYIYDPFNNYEDRRDVTSNAGALGFLVGSQSVSRSGFVFDFFLGGMIILNVNKENARDVSIPLVNPYNRGVALKAGIGLGLAR